MNSTRVLFLSFLVASSFGSICLSVELQESNAGSDFQGEIPQVVVQDDEELDILNHLSTHAITGTAAQIGLMASAIAGLVAMHYTSKADFPTLIGRKLGLVEKDFLCENYAAIHICNGIPLYSCLALGFLSVYKTPGWTDKYLLKYKDNRCAVRNIITFINRAIIPWPIGIFSGEYFFLKEKKSKIEAMKKQKNNC